MEQCFTLHRRGSTYSSTSLPSAFVSVAAIGTSTFKDRSRENKEGEKEGYSETGGNTLKAKE